MRSAARFALWAVLAVLLSGCGRGADVTGGAAPEDQTSPEATVLKMNEALLAGDRQRYEQTLLGTQEQLQAAAALYEMAREQLAFREAMLEAYGPQGWDRVQHFFVLPSTDLRPWQREPVGEDRVDLVNRREQTRLELQRRDGQWYVRAAAMIPQGARAEQVAQVHLLTRDRLAQIRPQIGRPGVTAADIRRQLQQAFGQVPQ